MKSVLGFCLMAALFALAAADCLADQPPAGVAADRWNRLAARCPEQQRDMLEVARAAGREGLPVGAIVTLVEEGLAKQAEAGAVCAAAQRRLDALREARKMVMDSGYPECGAPPQQALMAAVASALECLVPRDALLGVLKIGGGTRAMRIKTVVEAGESLKLLGLDAAAVASFMGDFAGRDLGRMEILRAIRFVEQQHRAGIAASRIREMLWQDR